MKKERLEAMSDGIIAIIITLIVYTINVPENEAFSMKSIGPIFRHVSIYAISFTVVAILWMNHHAMFRPLEHVSLRIVWLNFLLLFCMSLIPLPTQALGQNFFLKDAHFFYGIIMTANATAYSLLYYEITRQAEHLNTQSKKFRNRMNLSFTCLYSLSIPLSFVNIYLPLLIFVIIPLYYFIPRRLDNA